jgi:hypothetical protein
LGRTPLLVPRPFYKLYFLFAKCVDLLKSKGEDSRSPLPLNFVPFSEFAHADFIEDCEAEVKWRSNSEKQTWAELQGGLGQECKGKSTYPVFKHLNGTAQAHRLPNMF